MIVFARQGAIQRYGSTGQLSTGQLADEEASNDTQPLVGPSSLAASYTAPEENKVEVRQPEAISFWRALHIPVDMSRVLLSFM